MFAKSNDLRSRMFYFFIETTLQVSNRRNRKNAVIFTCQLRKKDESKAQRNVPTSEHIEKTMTTCNKC